MDESSISQNRRSRRSNVLLAASLEVSGGTLPVKLRNLSAEGALIQGEGLPIEGSEVVFCRNDLSVGSRVAWVQGNHAGVAFNVALAPEDVLRNIPKAKPRMKPEFKRPGFTCRELTADERRMFEVWAATAWN